MARNQAQASAPQQPAPVELEPKIVAEPADKDYEYLDIPTFLRKNDDRNAGDERG